MASNFILRSRHGTMFHFRRRVPKDLVGRDLPRNLYQQKFGRKAHWGGKGHMRKSRYNEQQMVMILRESDTALIVEVAKKCGISDQTINLWRKRFGALQADYMKRLRGLEEENAWLKKSVAERDLAIEVMKEITAKKW
jgi:putative transposase